ncbi:S-layer homology domain-containing protein [Cohnella abietis]|nr:S-layer homology domain-containing protein [Cohnella abietis]
MTRHRWNQPLKLILATLVATSIWSAAGAPQHASAASSDVQQLTQNRAKQDILAKWLQYRPMDMVKAGYTSEDGIYNTDAIYKQAPQLIAPYSPGKLKPQYIEDGINAANFVRYLAGVPDDLVADSSLEQQQQTGALLNAVNKQLSHHPVQPADMSQSQFDLGYKATSSSNLFLGSNTFYDNVLGYMSDSDASNIDRVGHRRWIINPTMKKTMFGMVYADMSYGYPVPFATMSAFNSERNPSEVSYDYVAWPSAGYFPQEVFSPNDAWSVSLNTSRYDKSHTNDIRVELVRERDERKWSFNASDTDREGKFFNVDTGGYGGIPYSIIFRPDGIEEFAEDDTFSVSITGVYGRDGQAQEIHFQTTMFEMLPHFTANAPIKLHVGETIQLRLESGTQTSDNLFVSSNSSIVSIDAQGRITGIRKGEAYVSVDRYIGDPKSKIVTLRVSGNGDEKVSTWAQGAYLKAKGNGLIPMDFDLNYQRPISRITFTGMAVRMLEIVMKQDIVENQVLHNDINSTPFRDVSDWAVNWANKNGIISGTSATTFSPDATITREQAAKLLLNVYDKALNMKKGAGSSVNATSGGIATATPFADDNLISPWAKNVVYEAVRLNLLQGTDSTHFDPHGKLTHEQTYVILERVFELIEG